MKTSIFACVILIFHYAAGEGDGPEYACDDDTDMYGEDGLPTHRPLIIAHRGSSGMFPEHSALAYRMAAEQGADVIECDLALTKDLHFVCMHEPWLNRTTDVADHPEFGHLLTTYEINDDDEEFDWNDKGNITSWFTFDMTLAELKTLKLKQPEVFRDPRYDWQESIPTLEELVEITREYAEKQNRVIGIYPEMKHAFAINKIFEFKSKGEPFTRFEDVALDTLQRLGFTSEKDPCFLQSFEFCSLEYVRNKTDLKLVLLLEGPSPSSRRVRLPSRPRTRSLACFGKKPTQLPHLKSKHVRQSSPPRPASGIKWAEVETANTARTNVTQQRPYPMPKPSAQLTPNAVGSRSDPARDPAIA